MGCNEDTTVKHWSSSILWTEKLNLFSAQLGATIIRFAYWVWMNWKVNIVLIQVTTDPRMEPYVHRKARTNKFKVHNEHVSGRRKEHPIKGSAVLEQKEVIWSTTFYPYIFLLYHLSLVILIVSYDALDMNLKIYQTHTTLQNNLWSWWYGKKQNNSFGFIIGAPHQFLPWTILRQGTQSNESMTLPTRQEKWPTYSIFVASIFAIPWLHVA